MGEAEGLTSLVVSLGNFNGQEGGGGELDYLWLLDRSLMCFGESLVRLWLAKDNVANEKTY